MGGEGDCRVAGKWSVWGHWWCTASYTQWQYNYGSIRSLRIRASCGIEGGCLGHTLFVYLKYITNLPVKSVSFSFEICVCQTRRFLFPSIFLFAVMLAVLQCEGGGAVASLYKHNLPSMWWKPRSCIWLVCRGSCVSIARVSTHLSLAMEASTETPISWPASHIMFI